MTIKFIDLGMQINPEKRSFAFYCEEWKSFDSQADNYTWTNWDDFQSDVVKEGQLSVLEIEELKLLCPTWVFQGGF